MIYPIHVLSLGAGVQSSTAALMAGKGEIDPVLTASIFADTQGEPESVYLWLSWLCGVEVKHDSKGRAYVEPGVYQAGVLTYPVHIVTAGSLEDTVLDMKTTDDGRIYSKVNIPFFTRNHDGTEGKIKHRACTRDYKIVPVRQRQKEMIEDGVLRAWRAKHRPALRALAAWRLECRRINKANKELQKNMRFPVPMRPVEPWIECQNDALVISWVGISLDEIGRVKESRDPWCRNRWPLIEARMHRNDCLNWMQKNGYPKPPRSACVYCPFHNDIEWRRLRDDEPQEFARAVQFERDLQTGKSNSENFKTTPYLHRQLVPLDKVNFDTEEDRGQGNLFENECEGMCGV